MTRNPDFKVTPLLDAEYNYQKRHEIHSYNTHALLKGVTSSDLE